LIILSASAIATLKKCPFRYFYSYVKGIRREETPEPLRVGTNWHEGLSVLSLNPEQPCPLCSDRQKPDKDCCLCMGTDYIDTPTDALARLMTQRYDGFYPWMPRDKAEIERVMLLYSLFAYKHNYAGEDTKTITREIPFRIPLIDPDTRKAIPGVVIDGMIDKLVKSDTGVAVMEHKSTSDSVDPGSDYWGHLRLDTQTMLYVYAAQRLLDDGLLAPYVKQTDAIGEIIYDVWHKPQISPKKLSQAETKAFIETGDYFGREFTPAFGCGDFLVDGESVEFELLKSGAPVIRETPEMFGCRLFADIGSRPDYYFARRLITRDSEELERFERELFSLYQTIAAMTENDSWYHNEHSCDNFGKCEYCQFCFAGTELDAEHPPVGFKCIFKKGTT
jgi:hypothetical protein